MRLVAPSFLRPSHALPTAQLPASSPRRGCGLLRSLGRRGLLVLLLAVALLLLSAQLYLSMFQPWQQTTMPLHLLQALRPPAIPRPPWRIVDSRPPEEALLDLLPLTPCGEQHDAAPVTLTAAAAFSPRCDAQRDAVGFCVPEMGPAEFTEAAVLRTNATVLAPRTPAQQQLQELLRSSHMELPLRMVPSPPRCAPSIAPRLQLPPSSAFHALQAVVYSRDGGAPPHLFARSTFAWASHAPPTVYFQQRGSLDIWGSSADLTAVSWFDGRLHLWGLSNAALVGLRLPRSVPAYKHFKDAQEATASEQLLFHPREALPLHQCAEWVEDTAVFHSLWEPSNAYHAHSENIMPLFSHLRSLKLLGDGDDAPARRLYLFTRGAAGAAPYFNRTATNVATDATQRLFRGDVHDVAELQRFNASHQVCFRHVRWGRGPAPGTAVTTLPSSRDCVPLEAGGLWPLDDRTVRRLGPAAMASIRSEQRFAHNASAGIIAGDALAYLQWSWMQHGIAPRVRAGWTAEGERQDWSAISSAAALGLPDASTHVDAEAARTDCEQNRRRPRVLWVSRSHGARSVVNEAEVIRWLRASGLWEADIAVCCAWSKGAPRAPGDERLVGHDPTELIALLRDADIIMGMHGAGLAHLLYMPPGGMVVELQPRRWNWLYFFPTISRGLTHLSLEIDLRAEQLSAANEALRLTDPQGEDAPVHLSRGFVDRLLVEVTEQWQRHSPCDRADEQARRAWHDRSTRSHAQRFPLADVLGNRLLDAHWSRWDD